MKFAGYMAWLLCKHRAFDEKNYYNSRDIEFFLGDYYFLARPVYLQPTNNRPTGNQPTTDDWPLI